ncbi:hypothetical protein [Leucobacter chromiireducens]|uniref:hypothetical protein n=1 Tax=Leucobacter chromiireducens TaxID=283877 RepID=UPI0019283C89|nr:hypothetical protein [Leucobacter chromiireducens]
MMARRQVSAAAEHTLTHWLDQVSQGQLPLQELPLCVSAWFHAGEAAGRVSRQPEIDQLNHLLDVYWARAFLTNDERRERILQRLDTGLQEADEKVWDRIEQELAQAAGQRQLNTQNSLRGGEHPPEQGVNHDSSSAPERRRRAA